MIISDGPNFLCRRSPNGSSIMLHAWHSSLPVPAVGLHTTLYSTQRNTKITRGSSGLHRELYWNPELVKFMEILMLNVWLTLADQVLRQCWWPII